MQARTLAALGAALLTIGAPGAAQAADQLAISAPAAAPATDFPVTTTVTADTEGTAFSYALSGSADCAATVTEMEGRTDIGQRGSTAAPAGQTVQGTFSFRQNRPGRFRLCAYLVDNAQGAAAAPPRARADALIVVGDPDRGDEIAVELPPPSEGAFTYTLRGHARDAGKALAFVEPGGTDCAPTVAQQAARPGVRAGDLIFFQAGVFTASPQLVVRPGPYRMCAYLQYNGEAREAAPRAIGTATGVRTGGDRDRDRDGVKDEADRCPDGPGRAPSGCPSFVLSGPTTVALANRRLTVIVREPVRCKVTAAATVLGTKLEASGRAPRPLDLRIPARLAKRLGRKASTKVAVKVTAVCGATTITATRRITVKR